MKPAAVWLLVAFVAIPRALPGCGDLKSDQLVGASGGGSAGSKQGPTAGGHAGAASEGAVGGDLPASGAQAGAGATPTSGAGHGGNAGTGGVGADAGGAHAAGSGAVGGSGDGGDSANGGAGGEGVAWTAAGAGSEMCDPYARFEPAVPVPGLEHGSYAFAQLTADELTIFLSVDDDDARWDLAIARRSSTREPFGTPTRLDVLSSGDNEHTLSVTEDGLGAFFETHRRGRYEIFGATRPDATRDFDPPQPVAGVNDWGNHSGESAPFVLPDGNTLYFQSFRSGNGDIYVSERRGGEFQTPRPVLAVNSPHSDGMPVLSEDELVLFFDSFRPGGKGGTDIWLATRAHRGAEFSPPINMGELNFDTDEFPNWLSPDGCRLYLGIRPGSDTPHRYLNVATRARH